MDAQFSSAPSPATGRAPNGRYTKGAPGRPPGATNRLSRRIVETILKDFEAHQANVLSHLRNDYVTAYIALVGRLLPKATVYEEAEEAEPLEVDPETLANDRYLTALKQLTDGEFGLEDFLSRAGMDTPKPSPPRRRRPPAPVYAAAPTPEAAPEPAPPPVAAAPVIEAEVECETVVEPPAEPAPEPVTPEPVAQEPAVPEPAAATAPAEPPRAPPAPAPTPPDANDVISPEEAARLTRIALENEAAARRERLILRYK